MLRHPVSYRNCRFDDLVDKTETLYKVVLQMEKQYAAIYKCKVALDKAQAARTQDFKQHQAIMSEYPAVL